MDQKVGMETDVIEQLVRLQDMDRARDRLQKKLDEVPVKLKSHTDGIWALERDLEESELLQKHARAEADRAELEVRSLEERREKIKQGMNAPKLSAREYETLQEELAGVLADINSFSDTAIKALDSASEADASGAETRAKLEETRAAYAEAKATLEGSLAGTVEDLNARNAKRAQYVEGVDTTRLEIYERVRRKHNAAMSIVDGTIDRAAGRIGNDLHCSACYMTITANDGVRVLARKEVVQCKSCVRILYVP